MIRRLLDALRRNQADPIPRRQIRPNELSREAARAERLRREARQAEAAARRPALPSEEERARRPRPPPVPKPPAPAARPLAASLTSRSELRRALLLKEILGPPAALRLPWDRNLER